MTRPVAWLMAGTLFALAGCASVPAPTFAGRTLSPGVVQQAVKINRDRVQSLSGSGTISVETLDMAQSGSFELTLRKPDSILVKIEGPFGIRVGSALVTRTGFTFYNSLQNQIVTGPVNEANLTRIFRVSLTFDELLNLFTGGSFLEGDGGSPDSIAIDDNQFVMAYGKASGARRYWIDPVTSLITKIQLTDVKGKLVLEERFDKFKEVGTASLPRQIRLTQHQSHRVVAVAFSSLDVGTDGAPLTIEIPNNAERVRWQ